MANSYDKGHLVKCAVEFKDSASNYQDPAAVLFKFRDPSGTETSYEYGQDGELVKDDTGRYHVHVDGDAEGWWHYRFYSTGSGQSADEGEFQIVTEF